MTSTTDRKRRKMSPTNQDATKNKFPAIGHCPHRRTESIDFDFDISIPVSEHDNTTNKNAIDEYFFHKEEQRTVPTVPTDTFATFTAAENSTFGTSQSFVGLEGLISVVEDNTKERNEPTSTTNSIIRTDDNAVGLDLDTSLKTNLNIDQLSHPLANMSQFNSSGSNGLEIPRLSS